MLKGQRGKFNLKVGAKIAVRIFFWIRPRKINVLFQVQKFSELNARTRKNYKKLQNYKVFFSLQIQIYNISMAILNTC